MASTECIVIEAVQQNEHIARLVRYLLVLDHSDWLVPMASALDVASGDSDNRSVLARVLDTAGLRSLGKTPGRSTGREVLRDAERKGRLLV